MDLQAELRQWGPDALGVRTVTVPEAEQYCRRLASSHYENFPVITRLLPRQLRQPFANVYAYCRWADDLADESPGAVESLKLLEWWRTELDACYQGITRHPVFVALRPTIAEYDIPQAPFEDLLSAFEQDQCISAYATFESLHDYCRRSADPVGRIVLHLCRAANEQNVRWSDSICTGLQLANFCQDVARDFDRGRVYLPQEEQTQFGYTESALYRRETNEAFIGLMQCQVARARKFLNEGLPLVDQLQGRVAIAIDMFARGGLRILDRIEQVGYRVWEQRPVLRKSDFAILAIAASGRAVCRGFSGKASSQETAERQESVR